MADARFSSPPVRGVDLTVYFEPVQGLQVSHFSALREAWRPEYSETAELPPLRPQNRGGDETSVLRVDQAWPFPYLMFGSSDNSGTVAFQNDRLVRSWRFTEGNPYPGFEQLSNDLSSRLDQFAGVVKQETEQQLSVVGAECQYHNRLDDSLGASSLLGFLTGWRPDLPEVALKTRYSGLRLHMCDDDELNGCGLWVSVDVDEDGVNLMMNTETDGPVEGMRLGGLDKAHDLLIKKFVDITSEEMQQQWGKQR